MFLLEFVIAQQPYHRWYSERHISTKSDQDKSSIIRSTKMEPESILSSFSHNSSSLISKSTYSTCNLQLNNNSNNSISNNSVDGITNQHTMMKNNNIINNTSECNKLQLASNSNLSMFVSEANSRNVNEDIVKEENIANYKTTHLIDDSQKLISNNKHISCQQRDTNNHFNHLMNGSSIPLNLCQVRLFFLNLSCSACLRDFFSFNFSKVQQSNFYSASQQKPIGELSIKRENDQSLNSIIHDKGFEDKKDENIFNTTLDLSQEDIQQTLSANMPLHRNEESIVHDTISFIENCTTNVQEEDDTFVNLDAFDMLIELPELESSRSNVISKNNHHENSLLNITEFCPDW